MPRSETHYWITATYQGKDILIYGGASYYEAEQKGNQELPCMFDIIALPTSDIGRASRMVKGQKLEQTRNIDESLKNLRHTL